MTLNFEFGSSESVKGHALVYFDHPSDFSMALATYIIILPIPIDVAKYVPPMFASQMANLESRDLSGFAFPPIPEEVPNLEELKGIASLRGDDLIYGGGMPQQFNDSMLAINEIVQSYADLYAQNRDAMPVLESPTTLDVQEMFFEIMSDRDRLSELAKIIGKLRFAVEGNDQSTIKETEIEIRLLAKYLPDHYRMEQLLGTAKGIGNKASELASLYLERCYSLLNEEFEKTMEIETRIQTLEP